MVVLYLVLFTVLPPRQGEVSDLGWSMSLWHEVTPGSPLVTTRDPRPFCEAQNGFEPVREGRSQTPVIVLGPTHGREYVGFEPTTFSVYA